MRIVVIFSISASSDFLPNYSLYGVQLHKYCSTGFSLGLRMRPVHSMDYGYLVRQDQTWSIGAAHELGGRTTLLYSNIISQLETFSKDWHNTNNTFICLLLYLQYNTCQDS